MENIWKTEVIKWRLSCLLYKELDIYRDSIDGIEMNAWWSLLKLRPHLGKYASAVMAVLLGGQPSGLQCNFKGLSCLLCDSREKDDKKHVLLYCEALSYKRNSYLQIVFDKMPQAMLTSYKLLNENQKMTFLLSGLQSKSTTEWPDTYEAIVRWVYFSYATRKNMYDSLDAINGT